MRLLRLNQHGELSLTKDLVRDIPPYAILSHTWGNDDDEVTFDDLEKARGKSKVGYTKLQFCGNQARKDKIDYFWVDTCCINNANHAELSEAITSMFRWYRDAVKCYVYLSDVSNRKRHHNGQTEQAWQSAFRISRWFTRGWTLQELLAPRSVEFFSREEKLLGDKETLEGLIHEITDIPIAALQGAPLSEFLVDERLMWAAKRETKKKEDKAYCLLGIFNVFMPLIYGEEDNAFVRLKEEIDKRSDNFKKSTASPSPSTTIPFRRDADFVDRKTSLDSRTLLEQIEQKCAAPAARVALVGIGDAGKSQLAIEYCHRLRERSPYTWVFWIHASNVDRIEQGYRKIAERMKIPGCEDPKASIFELVARWLEDESRSAWLLVLDNLTNVSVTSTSQNAATKPGSDDKDSQLRHSFLSYLPRSANGAILVTTRTSSAAAKIVELGDVIMVDPMTDIDAITLLKKKLRKSADERDLEELARLLEFMPLAIVQAAAYIQQKGVRYSVQRYIEAFQKNEKQQTSLLKYEAGHLRRDRHAKNSIITTWQISFDEIRENWPSSADLLSLMSYFDRQGIPEDVLKVQLQKEKVQDSMKQNDDGVRDDENDEEDSEDDGASEMSSDSMFEEAVERLRSYSFISIGADGRTFEMHRLVQLATRKWLKVHGEDEKWKAQFCMKLNAVFPQAYYENWSLCETLFPHAKSAERQRPINNISVREWARILRMAGWYAWLRGDYVEAERMCEKSAGALKKALGEEDVETLSSSGVLALVYREQRRWTEAEQMQMQVMETEKRVRGEEHLGTLISISNLASTYGMQGRWTEAEQMQMQVIKTSKRVLGEEHPDTLISMANLATTYGRQGRWTEAEQMEVTVLQTKKRVLGEEHPGTLVSMHNLAFTMKKLGRRGEAIELMAECVQLRNRVLGTKHPHALLYAATLARWQNGE